MRIIQVHNNYRQYGGECTVFDKTVSLLRENGHDVFVFSRSSLEIGRSFGKKMMASLHSAFSVPSLMKFARFLKKVKPDLVHVHNLYPLITPSILTVCKQSNIPVVMTCHNYRLVCPIGICFTRGTVCDSCRDGRGYRCFMKNCRNDWLESAVYAVRNTIAEKFGLFQRHVDCFLVVSNFLGRFMIKNGFAEKKIAIVPNPVSLSLTAANSGNGQYVGYVGRVTPEKGIDHFIEMARRLPDIPFLVAGDKLTTVILKIEVPRNVQFLGFLSRAEINQFYRNARIVVVPSIYQEPFGLVAIEAMSNGLPVVAFRSGYLSEIVEENETGRLCDPFDTEELVRNVAELWARPALCKKMGEKAYERVATRYSDSGYVQNLLVVYRQAIRRLEKCYGP